MLLSSLAKDTRWPGTPFSELFQYISPWHESNVTDMSSEEVLRDFHMASSCDHEKRTEDYFDLQVENEGGRRVYRRTTLSSCR